jgi:peptide/nickel transport system substrate-binding protein
VDDGFNLQFRRPFDVLYLGINQKGNKKLADIRVRRAIAYALDREKLVKTKLPDKAMVATQFVPPGLDGYAKDIRTYEYDIEKAKALLKAAHAEDLTLRFHYPTGATPPYLPDPQGIYDMMAADLAQVGIELEPEPEQWSQGYLGEVTATREHDLHLLGRAGDYSYVGDFVGTCFGQGSLEFGDEGMKRMFAAIDRADSSVDVITRDAAWENVNRNLMNEWLPAIPIAYTPSAMVLTKNVKGLPASPLAQEQFGAAYFD